MESSSPPTVAKRLWHMVRVVYYMLRKGISKRKIMMDLHLLLKRGKLAGKALGNLMTFHHHHHHGGAASSTTTTYSSFSCRSMDPNLSFYNPREVEFSCSNTPSYPSFNLNKRSKHRHHQRDHVYDYEAAAAIARAFEILNSEVASEAESVAPSPSPARWAGFGKSPAKGKQLRITDSPFPIKEEEEVVDGKVDKEAEEFIKRFYEQLRLQQRVGATPEYKFRRA